MSHSVAAARRDWKATTLWLISAPDRSPRFKLCFQHEDRAVPPRALVARACAKLDHHPRVIQILLEMVLELQRSIIIGPGNQAEDRVHPGDLAASVKLHKTPRPPSLSLVTFR